MQLHSGLCHKGATSLHNISETDKPIRHLCSVSIKTEKYELPFETVPSDCNHENTSTVSMTRSPDHIYTYITYISPFSPKIFGVTLWDEKHSGFTQDLFLFNCDTAHEKQL